MNEMIDQDQDSGQEAELILSASLANTEGPGWESPRH